MTDVPPHGSRPLDGSTIREYLHEVAEELPAGPKHVLVLVGGALLAWAGLRGTTTDVDSIRRLDPQLRKAVKRVASRHGLPATWVNDNAAGMTPRTLREAEFRTLREHPRLVVLGASWHDVFLMKMFAARDTDFDDLIKLWPLSGFTNPKVVVEEFYAAYPHEQVDPYLVRYVEQIRRAAGG